MKLTEQEKSDVIMALSVAAEREGQIVERLTEQSMKFHASAIRERQSAIRRFDELRSKLRKENE